MLAGGIYPASVTPFDEKGKPDYVSFAKLLAYFQAAGCAGVALCATNGEGVSLSARERRDVWQNCQPLLNGMPWIAGVATTSMDEAKWLLRQASELGAKAALVLPPFYFQGIEEDAVVAWYHQLLSASPIPIIVYHFPKYSGTTLSAEAIRDLGHQPMMTGVKDSSGDRANLASYRAALPDDKVLLVGNEFLLADSLAAGWNGSISGAANVIPHWLVAIHNDFQAGNVESSETKMELVARVLHVLRGAPQPSLNKAILHQFRILSSPLVRLPLTDANPETVEEFLTVIKAQLGIHPDNLGLPRGVKLT